VKPDWFYWPNFLSPELSKQWLEELKADVVWEHGSLKMYGKELPFPRLMAWYGEEGSRYRFSGKTYNPLPFTEIISTIKSTLELSIRNNAEIRELLPKQGFNSVLLNWYRDGKDSMSWHSDDESELGEFPVIASLSLGAERWFHFRNKPSYPKFKQKISLQSGSVLLMYGDSQRKFQHALPKTKLELGDRINLTFRTIYN